MKKNMDLCSVCDKTCESNKLKCDYCHQLTHYSCCGMSKEEANSWSPFSMKFVCKACGFNGEKYDVSAALVRLTIENLTGRRNSLRNQALCEEKLLCTYKVHIPMKEDIFYSTTEVDPVSVGIIKMFEPSLANDMSPLKTGGDGNCLYRAVSLALSGSEEHHLFLRLITAIELILNNTTYNTRKKDNNFLGDVRIVTSPYEKLVADAIRETTYSEMAYLYALSAALGIPVRSYFPPQLKSELSEAFNRTVYGRCVKEDVPSHVTVMWSSASAPRVDTDFHVNHFVPLIKNTFLVDPTSPTSCNMVEFESNPEDYDRNLSENCVVLTKSESVSACHESASVIYESVSAENESLGLSVENESLGLSTENESLGLSVDNESLGLSAKNESDPTTGHLSDGFMNIEAVLQLLTSDVSGRDCIPSGIKENMYIILDNTDNIERRKTAKRSNFKDDCGVWDTSKGSSPKSYYIITDNGLKQVCLRNGLYCIKKQVKGKSEYHPIEAQANKSVIVGVHRYYTVLKKDPSYKKKVTWLADCGIHSNNAIVEYIGKFPGLAPHGKASDCTTEYHRIPPKVMKEIDDLTGKMKPHQIANKLSNKYDVLEQPSHRQVLDRQYRQRKKDRRVDGHTDNFADQVQHLENLVSNNHPFVRSVIRTSGKPPAFICYTDEQLTDLKYMCCTGKTILGIDKTFMLCKMHVTVTCYKQLSIEDVRTHQNPIFLGPMFIHDNSDFETFSHFFYHLKLKLHDSPVSKLVIGSDDEKALVKAITAVFPEATHVLCTRHLEENARHILQDDTVSKKQRVNLLDKIFGQDRLIDADDTICYDEQVREIETEMTEVSSKFLAYFQKRLIPALKEKVNDPQRQNKVIQHWTNNNCESMNHVLKQTVDWKSKPLPELVSLVLDLVNGQFKRIRSSIVRVGDYRLTDMYRQFERSKTDWISLTDKQKVNIYNHIRHHVPKEGTQVTSTDGKTTVLAPRTNGRKPGQRKRKPKTISFSLKKKKT